MIAGEIVLDGTDFRNGAHFRFKADLFVPCGGRSVDDPIQGLLYSFSVVLRQ